MRAGQKAVESGVEQVQHKVDRFFQASIDKLGPVRKAREEMEHLRERLEELEGSLSKLEKDRRSKPQDKPMKKPLTKPIAARPLRRGKGEDK